MAATHSRRARLGVAWSGSALMAWSLAVLSAALFIGYIPLRAAAHATASTLAATLPPQAVEQLQMSVPELIGTIFTYAGYLTYSTLGALIVSRRPENRIGWIFCSIGFSFALVDFVGYYAIYGLVVQPGALPGSLAAAWLQNWFWVVGVFLGVVFLPLLFPTGRLPSPRWWPVAWFAVGATVALTCGAAFHPGPLYNDLNPFDVSNPLAIGAVGSVAVGNIVDAVGRVGFGLVLISMLAAAASLILRLHRARGDERQQLKWFAYFGTMLAVLFVVTALVRYILRISTPAFEGVFAIAWPIALTGLPIAAGLAILKYRLYDIDLLINRTLVYGTLTAMVVALYVLGVGTLSALFQTTGNVTLSLLATGVIAILFHPLRQRLQRAVNRLMYGERDDPYTVLSHLGQRLEGTLAPEAVLPTLVETIAQALKLSYAAIALTTADHGQQTAATYPPSAVGAPPSDVIRLPLSYQHETIGQLILAPHVPGEAFSPAERRLLNDLARQAGVAAHAVRITTDLQRSRERLVTAREEERRRLRRDLHDGLGPQLASLTLKLETARNRLAHDSLADALLTDLTARTQAAVADIRRLVYELRPPTLDELGLVSALREGAAQYSQPGPNGVCITIDAPECLPPLPAAVEVAAYRIAQEALTNVVRHAGARTCVVRLTLDEAAGWLCLEVRDDGQGLPAPRQIGVGLNSMRERAEELGGTWTIEPVLTGGTRVLARLPCRLPETADPMNPETATLPHEEG